MIRITIAIAIFLLFGFTNQPPVERFLYVAEDQGWIYIYDINNDHKLVRKFEVPGTGEFKGICADPIRGKLYLSSYVNDQLVCVDLKTEKIDWKLYIPGYGDSPAITPDGKYIYMPRRYSRFWDIVDKYKVNILYTAPTAIRSLMSYGLDPLKGKDLSSLKVLGTVGEPINEEAWHWYDEHIGKKKCPIVDTWWQTETGACLISNLAGVTPAKPSWATLPMPGVQPILVDEQGKEITETD